MLIKTVIVFLYQIFHSLNHTFYKKFIILRGCVTVLSPDYKPYDAIQIVRMTFDGCDYLEAIKNDTIWNNVKKDLKRIGGSASLDIVKTLAVNIGLKILQE